VNHVVFDRLRHHAGDIEVMPRIDGRDLTDLVHEFERERGWIADAAAYGGLIPAWFEFGPMDLHFLGRGAWLSQGLVPVLGCECGEWGCWPLHVRIVENAHTVTWSEFAHLGLERDYTGLGPFQFDREAYVHALAVLVESAP
jgi:hypothetical protein